MEQNIGLHLFRWIILLIVFSLPSSLQDCSAPTITDPNIIFDPAPPGPYLTYYPVTISCPSGSSPPSPTQSYCQAGSPDYWSPDPSAAVCEALCPKPSLNDSAVIITPNQTTYDPNTDIAFSCSDGSTPGGSQSSNCQSDGTWDYVTEPSCPKTCGTPPNSNGTRQYSNAEQVTFSCVGGYGLVGSGDTVQSTCDDGDWNPNVVCVSIGCVPPDVPENVMCDPVNGPYETNSKVALSCDGERTPSGPQFSYCNGTGQWVPDPMTLKCRDKCEVPSFDDHMVQHSSDLRKTSGQDYYDHADTIRFFCDGGLFVDGPWKASCHDGIWSAPIGGHRPVCRDNCTAPVNFRNQDESFQHGRSHVFECDDTPGLVRMGGPKSFCNDGVWKPRIRCDFKKNLRKEEL